MDRIITLTTDFGTLDGYVGVMKGVILGINPRATLVDITHEVEPQNVEQGAFLLAAAGPYFPPGTIHLVVVDPGVGTARRPVAVQSGESFFVAPDNGVLSLALGGSHFGASQSGETVIVPLEEAVLTQASGANPFRAVHLDRPGYWLPDVSNTFHGRDIFAPSAAHLSLGVPLEAMGSPIADLIRLNLAARQLNAPGAVGLPLQRPSAILGRVIHIDHFGNCITNVPKSMLTPLYFQSTISIAGRSLKGIQRTYSDVERGQPLALVGSTNYLEIAVRDGSAAAQLGIRLGDQITLVLTTRQ